MTDKEVEDVGYCFAAGFIKRSLQVAIAWMFLYTLFFLLTNQTDDSDTSYFNRSGLEVHLDAKTGIEYLSDGNGGLIRRELK